MIALWFSISKNCRNNLAEPFQKYYNNSELSWNEKMLLFFKFQNRNKLFVKRQQVNTRNRFILYSIVHYRYTWSESWMNISRNSGCILYTSSGNSQITKSSFPLVSRLLEKERFILNNYASTCTKGPQNNGERIHNLIKYASVLCDQNICLQSTILFQVNWI